MNNKLIEDITDILNDSSCETPEFGISERSFDDVAEKIIVAANNYYQDPQSPSSIYKPKLSVDGNMFCALLGENLQNGIAGFGPTPNEAMKDFDNNFYNKKLEPAKEKQGGI